MPAGETPEATAISPADLYLQQPVWSPDGEKIAMSGRGYKGVWIMTRDGQNLVELSDGRGAGYGFDWSRDSERIVFRTFEYVKRRRSHVIRMIDIASRVTSTLGSYRGGGAGLPLWRPDDAGVLLKTRRGFETLPAAPSAGPRARTSRTAARCYNTGTSVVIFDAVGNETARLQPVAGTYLNAAMSPAGGKVAIEVYGGDLFVVNVDGSGLTDLGRGERPAWSPDGKALAFMLTTDDGHSILNSDIFVAPASGGARQNLTASADRIEMDPDWSPDGSTLLFDERNSGRIYQLRMNR